MLTAGSLEDGDHRSGSDNVDDAHVRHCNNSNSAQNLLPEVTARYRDDQEATKYLRERFKFDPQGADNLKHR